MPSQLITPPETLPAHPAATLLLGLVDLLVLAKITALREAAPAAGEVAEERLLALAPGLLALERLVASVGAHVALERLGGAELVVAFRALARLVAPRAVDREGETTASGPAADEAEGLGERCGVNGLDVRLQGGFCGEGFAAGRRGGGVMPLADGDGEVGVGLGGGG
ncbi:hypothetical protein V498_10198, partial [Pseudogymnoascus sp. VKM F-4517 (FW-2822)]